MDCEALKDSQGQVNVGGSADEYRLQVENQETG
jgi:hypothetical protein